MLQTPLRRYQQFYTQDEDSNYALNFECLIRYWPLIELFADQKNPSSC